MTYKDWINLLAIVMGPLLAVLVTLWIEERRRIKDQRTQTLRMLLSTRHLPSDPAYSTALNLIPVDFNSKANVMSAWQAYIEKTRFRPLPQAEEAHRAEMINKQTKLIFAMTQCLGYKLPETDISISAYAADGFIFRDNVFISAWQAWPRIAEALERQTAMLTGGGQLPPDDK